MFRTSDATKLFSLSRSMSDYLLLFLLKFLKWKIRRNMTGAKSQRMPIENEMSIMVKALELGFYLRSQMPRIMYVVLKTTKMASSARISRLKRSLSACELLS